jgi:hypothetical protein
MDDKKISALWRLLESPFTWGGVGMFIGVAISDPVWFKYGFIGSCLAIGIGALRAGFFDGRSLRVKWGGNLMLCVCLTIGAREFWRIMPKPDKPFTAKDADQMLKGCIGNNQPQGVNQSFSDVGEKPITRSEFITLFQQSMAKTRSRAYLHVDRVTIAVGRNHGIPLTIKAHIYGHNISFIEPTTIDPIVNAAIIVRPYIEPDHVVEEASLFTKPGEWTGAGYIALNHALNPLQSFEFEKEESLTNLDSIPFSFDAAKKIRDKTWVIYVVTRATYADKWGPLPEVKSCTVFIAANNSLDDLQQGMCWGMYQP